MRTRHLPLLLTSLAMLPLLACAGSRPMELRAAHQEFNRAQGSQAARLAPSELQRARLLLDEAEAAYAADPFDPEMPDLAYLAWRQAQLAEAMAETTRVDKVRAAAVKQLSNLQTAQAISTKNQLSQSQQQLQSQQQQLQSEQQARADAERKVREAEDKLSKLAEIRHDERGTVLTLSGSVLFVSGKSELLPSAQERLDTVAEALKSTQNRIVVEGYTDSKGSSAKNRRLSKDRAESVRDYLVSRGVDANQVAAVGLGPASPVASNKSVEGRANNRRVEIVIQPSQPAGPATPGTPGLRNEPYGHDSLMGDEDKKDKAGDDKGMKDKDKKGGGKGKLKPKADKGTGKIHEGEE